MNSLLKTTFWLTAGISTCVCTPMATCARAQETSPQPHRREPTTVVYKQHIEPHWYADSSRFWYRNDLSEGRKEFIAVDATAGERREAFHHTRLANALAKASDAQVDAERLPFNEIHFSADEQVIHFSVDDQAWACNLDSYSCWRIEKDQSLIDKHQGRGNENRRRERNRTTRRDQQPESPDMKWRAVIRDHNIVLQQLANDTQDATEESVLTTDGGESQYYDLLQWSPDSQVLVAFRVTPGDEKKVHLLESSPSQGGRARLHSRPYSLPGDKFPAYKIHLFRIDDRRQIKPETEPLEMEWGRPRIVWLDDGEHLAYEKIDRGHQRYRLIEVNTNNGEVRHLIDERTDTFIWTAHTENVNVPRLSWLEHSDEVIYASERDGWRHLYLVDTKAGKIKHPITRGEFVVRGLDQIDEANRQLWFRASGMHADQDPYFIHHYRIDFDGSGLTALTKGNGNHRVQFSPDRRFLIDTYSRVDMPPQHELRSAADGSLVCDLETADATALVAGGWRPPEVFVAQGRDGTTDIWGILCRPPNFDPAKKYPVIEHIYAGPQSAYVPKSFSTRHRFQSLTDLGFIVVQIDGMGTAHRSKAFHDVCWQNLKDAGFPDRILWMKAAEEKYPEIDLARVGIYGGSAGGQNACAALLFHPDFYKVGVAGCGCHDNRLDKASWNEQWMGYPVGPQYAECSNVDNAHRLEGKLMLILGELDKNVPIESTLRLVDALVKADKDFDFVFVPGAGHGMGGRYGSRRMQDFFVRHLQENRP